MKILFIRHGESTGNQAQRISGRETDDLTSKGEQQVKRLGEFLKQSSWAPTHCYCSPLLRAQRTIEILFNCCHLTPLRVPMQTMVDLQEIHHGVLQGLTWQEAQDRHPELCAQLEASPTWIPIPEAESLQACRDRAHQGIHHLLQQHQNTDRLWVVSHGGILPYLVAALLEMPKVWGVQIAPTALFEFELALEYWTNADQNRYNPTLWQVHQFNERPHLIEG